MKCLCAASSVLILALIELNFEARPPSDKGDDTSVRPHCGFQNKRESQISPLTAAENDLTGVQEAWLGMPGLSYTYTSIHKYTHIYVYNILYDYITPPPPVGGRGGRGGGGDVRWASALVS